MYSYLYTNDMRISDLSNSIKRVSQILLSGMEPYQVDKSFGNNGATIQFYFNLQHNTETLTKGESATLEVIRNFILKFQFPNTRTLESFRNTLNDKIFFAPYRAIISVLYKLALLNGNKSHLTHREILFFFFCNSEVCTNPEFNIDKLINSILNYRNNPFDIDSYVRTNIQWNQYERQLREMLTVLQYASDIFKNWAGTLSFNITQKPEDIAFINDVVSYNKIWYPSNIEDFNLSNKEYISYMDTAKTPYSVIEFNHVHETSPKILNDSLQQIFYGAPGTGKSHAIDNVVTEDNSIRTTFHPDSDYASFVGVYKPTMEETGVTVASKKETRIAYKYVPQAFLKAYINAWSLYDPAKDNPFYLVIEEINRGNCAQIFGDLFQLLDRNNMGASSYSIYADDDIRHFIDEEDGGFKGLSEKQRKIISEFVLVKDTGKKENIGEAILNGTKLLLPPNMRIWATMNTSDQSLFPIDSAFKRRWDWKYIPIEYDKENWVFEVGGKHYNWGEFLSKINPEIYTITESPDKQMGYYFAKANPTTGIISQDTFLNKVLFYLWTDVFKDYDVASTVFKNKKTNRAFRFTDFFEDDEALGNFIENMELVSEDGPVSGDAESV